MDEQPTPQQPEEQSGKTPPKGKTSSEQLPTQGETIHELKDALEKVERERDEYLAGWKRAKADLLNYQREINEKQRELHLWANAALVSNLLPILDSFDLALHAVKPEDLESPIGKGIHLIKTQLIEALRQNGLEEFRPVNAAFDPRLHEVIARHPCQNASCSGEDENTIMQVISPGYLFKGHILRTAKVKVITHGH